MPLNISGGRFIRFLLVGGVNTVFSYSLYALLIYMKVHYSLAALLGNIISVLFNFNTTGRLVFRNSSNSLLIKFAAVYAVTYLLGVSALWVFNSFKFDMYLAGMLLILPMAVISFMLNSKFVFKEKKTNGVH